MGNKSDEMMGKSKKNIGKVIAENYVMILFKQPPMIDTEIDHYRYQEIQRQCQQSAEPVFFENTHKKKGCHENWRKDGNGRRYCTGKNTSYKQEQRYAEFDDFKENDNEKTLFSEYLKPTFEDLIN